MSNAKMQMVRAQKALAFQRQKGNVLTPHALQLLLLIAMRPGITSEEIEADVGIASSSVSRTLMALGDYHRSGNPGLGLTETVPDPYERRRYIAFLTEAGYAFVREYLRHLTGEEQKFEHISATEHQKRAYGKRRAS